MASLSPLRNSKVLNCLEKSSRNIDKLQTCPSGLQTSNYVVLRTDFVSSFFIVGHVLGRHTA